MKEPKTISIFLIYESPLADSMEEKYPVSRNNYQCIGPCYPPDSFIIHPVTLNDDVRSYSMCPIHPTVVTDSTGTRVELYDFCSVPTAKAPTIGTSQQAALPTFKFDPVFFLKLYYNIGSLEEGFEWIDANADLPYKTKERVFNQIVVLYGNNLSLADHRLINHVHNIMTHNIALIFRAIVKYVRIDDSDKTNISLRPPLSSDSSVDISAIDKTTISLVNAYIKSKLIGVSEINSFLNKFFRYGVSNISVEQRDSFTKVVVDSMIDYIIQRIEVSFK